MDEETPIERGGEGGGKGGANESEGAKAGAGDPPKATERPTPKRRSGGRKRGDPDLEPSLNELVRDIGRNKLAPDVTAVERHYARSLTIRRLVGEFLTDNVGSVWRDPMELYARAANYAGCATNTAQRWTFQLTRAGAPFKLVEAIDHWTLERRNE